MSVVTPKQREARYSTMYGHIVQSDRLKSGSACHCKPPAKSEIWNLKIWNLKIICLWTAQHLQNLKSENLKSANNLLVMHTICKIWNLKIMICLLYTACKIACSIWLKFGIWRYWFTCLLHTAYKLHAVKSEHLNIWNLKIMQGMIGCIYIVLSWCGPPHDRMHIVVIWTRPRTR